MVRHYFFLYIIWLQKVWRISQKMGIYFNFEGKLKSEKRKLQVLKTYGNCLEIMMMVIDEHNTEWKTHHKKFSFHDLGLDSQIYSETCTDNFDIKSYWPIGQLKQKFVRRYSNLQPKCLYLHSKRHSRFLRVSKLHIDEISNFNFISFHRNNDFGA